MQERFSKALSVNDTPIISPGSTSMKPLSFSFCNRGMAKAEIAQDEDGQPADEEEAPQTHNTEQNGTGDADEQNEDSEAAVHARAKGSDGETHGYEAVTLAFRTFETPEQMYRYFSNLLNTVTLDQNLNEYEHKVLEQLLRKGHHNADAKIGVGVKALQARAHTYFANKSFFVIRTDGSKIDFSYRKCIENLMPTEAGQELLKLSEKKKRKHEQRRQQKRSIHQSKQTDRSTDAAHAPTLSATDNDADEAQASKRKASEEPS
jgi:hypothetical protein